MGLSKRGKYGKPEAFTLVGTYCGHAKGFGFVTVEGMDQDVFIPAEKTKDAMHGDTCLLYTSYPDFRRSGSCHGSQEAADQGCFSW